MIDAIDSLSFSLHSSKGVYALLLGSGVSRAAQIPTGWEVTEDLIARVAEVRKAQIEGDPARWYEVETGKPPNYSSLLAELAPSRGDRQAILKGYFEPTDQEAAQGIKTPTLAHRAIARMVRDGVLRVICTTNFDRLLELALRAEGIEPTVISSPADIEGAPPLPHVDCVVVKLHGDYLDARLKNTEEELATYSPRMKGLLRRILDDFGLIVCGWSAEWDIALCSALKAAKSQRYTTYWTAYRGHLTDEASHIVASRKARVIEIEDGDSFFEDLAERVRALTEFDRPHPISKAIAVTRLETYLPESGHRIRLHNLLRDETEKVANQLENRPRSWPDNPNNRLQWCEALTETLEALLAHGTYHGTVEQVHFWVQALQRLVGSHESALRNTSTRLWWYPLTRLLYSAGLGAFASRKFGVFWQLLAEPRVRLEDGRRSWPVTRSAAPWGDNFVQITSGHHRWPTDAHGSEHLLLSLRPTMADLISDNEEWERLFFQFEFLKALADARLSESDHCHLGLFAYAMRRSESWPGQEILAGLQERGRNWEPLEGGFLGGDETAARAALEAILERVPELRPF